MQAHQHAGYAGLGKRGAEDDLGAGVKGKRVKAGKEEPVHGQSLNSILGQGFRCFC
jgi:hypothetical protein